MHASSYLALDDVRFDGACRHLLDRFRLRVRQLRQLLVLRAGGRQLVRQFRDARPSGVALLLDGGERGGGARLGGRAGVAHQRVVLADPRVALARGGVPVFLFELFPEGRKTGFVLAGHVLPRHLHGRLALHASC